MNEEEIYTFNDYILGYEKGNNDRSCLTISKIINDDMYVMSSLYDGSADVISMILDNLQQENKQLKEQLEASERARKEAIDYINFLVIIDTQLAGGRFKDTIWGKELLEILDIDKGE